MVPSLQLVTEAIGAYNAGDVEGYFSRHSANTTLEQPPDGPADIDTYRAQVLAARQRWPALTVRITRLHDAGAVVVMESTVDFGDGRRPHSEAVVFDLAPDGLIDRTRVYSAGPIALQL